MGAQSSSYSEILIPVPQAPLNSYDIVKSNGISSINNNYTSHSKLMKLPNPHLLGGDPPNDILHHFGFAKKEHELIDSFAAVKFVCIGGSSERMRRYAERYATDSRRKMSENLSRSDRYSMWRTGEVLWVNHGIGAPSLSVMLSELLKLLHYAMCSDVKIIRMGTCGGIGVEPGTVVITTRALNGLLQPKHVQYIAGKQVERDTTIDPLLAGQLFGTAQKLKLASVKGATLCADDFYEGQMRLDGLFCDYTEANKQQFLGRLREIGVKNIEMECTCLAAFTHRAGISAAIVCVTLLDRLEGDQIHLSVETLKEYEMRPYLVVSHYIREYLAMYGVEKLPF